MPVFAYYNFDDADTTALDSALGNGAQNGVYLNGATAAAGQAVLDGDNDLIKIYPDPAFQLDRGTLDIAWTMGGDALSGPQTLLSRDSSGTTDGGYRIEILANGAVVISHETATGTQTFGQCASQLQYGGFAQVIERLSICVSTDKVHTIYITVHHMANCVTTAAANAYYFDFCILWNAVY